jgi:ACS family glucarate transporter-like MFS transporter
MVTTNSSRIRWLLIFWLFVLSAVAFLDRVNISVAGGSLATAYHLTNVQLGWVFSAFLIGYALFQTPGGRLADRVGPRRVLAGGVVWWGIFTALTVSVPSGVAHAIVLLIYVRFLLGAGEAVMYPAANQFVARWIPDDERGIANGWIFAGVGAGAGLSPPLITFLMLRYGWRSSFWVCAVIGVIAGTVWFLIARDDPESHSRVSPSELALIQRGRAVPRGRSEGQQLIAWSTILKSRDVWAVTISYFTFGYVAWIFFSWFYLYLAQARHLALKTSAVYSMLPFIAMAVGCLIGGKISDLLSRKYNPRVGRCYFAAFGIALSGVFLMLGAEAQGARLASIVLAGGAGALYLAQSSFWSVTAALAESSSGSVSGFMNMGAQIGGAVTASLTPVIANRFGWTASFLTAASLCVLGAIAWIVVDPQRKLEGEPKAISVQTS